MADCVPARIVVGGVVHRSDYPAFLTVLEGEGFLAGDDDAGIVEAAVAAGTSLEFDEDEVPWGYFACLEKFCVDHGLPFVRWCGSQPGSWPAQRVVFSGAGEPRAFLATESDEVVLTALAVEELGSIDAINAWFAAADVSVPPLALVDGEVVHG